MYGLKYIGILEQDGLLGSDDIPPCPLDFSAYGSHEFVEQFVNMVAYGGDGKGNDSQFGKDISGDGQVVVGYTTFYPPEYGFWSGFRWENGVMSSLGSLQERRTAPTHMARHTTAR